MLRRTQEDSSKKKDEKEEKQEEKRRWEIKRKSLSEEESWSPWSKGENQR